MKSHKVLILFLLLILCVCSDMVYAQTDSIKLCQADLMEKMVQMEKKMQKLSVSYRTLRKQSRKNSAEIQNVSNAVAAVDCLWQKQQDSLRIMVDSYEQQQMQLDEKVKEANIDTGNKLSSMEHVLDFRTFIGAVAVLCLLAIIIVIWMLIRLRVNRNAKAIDDVVMSQKVILAESQGVQAELLACIRALTMEASANSLDVERSMVFQMADGLTVLDANIFHLNSSCDGYDKLKSFADQVRDVLSSVGYQVDNLIGVPFDDNLHVVATFVNDSSYSKGARVITAVKVPHITFHGVTVQKAHVVVTQNI